MANSEDPNQTAPIWVCTVCPGVSVLKFRIIMVHCFVFSFFQRFTQYLASNNCTFNLANFIDKTGVQGKA